jgi:hypothetical protein
MKKGRGFVGTAAAAVALFAVGAGLDTSEAHAAFNGIVFRSLCGSAGQPLNPLVPTGVEWTVPPDDDSLCRVTQTALDPSYPLTWLLHFPAERTTLSATQVIGRAQVFGGGFPVQNICVKTITFRANGAKYLESFQECTSGSASNQYLVMVGASLPGRGAVVMRFNAFGGASILRGDIQFRTEGTDSY